MGNRLTKIYTRTGDAGTTGLGNGRRVPKDHLRVEAYGTVDELNSAIGVLLAVPGLPAAVSDCLRGVQHRLFDIGGELCLPGHAVIDEQAVASLEQHLDEFNAHLPPLKDFVLPGGAPAAANCHLARTVCRRAERRCWTLAHEDTVNEYALKYLNRLSDLLFVVARVINRAAGCPEPLWEKDQG
jgi:cob(I)alamin adenosyltransferase